MIKGFLPGIARVFSNITPILIFFIFAQLINIEQLGLLNYIISLITIIGIVTDFGIPEAIQRFLPQTKKKKGNLITYTLKLEFLIVFTGALIFLILDLLSNGDFSKGYLFILLLTIVFSASNTIILIYNGLQEKSSVSKYFVSSATIFFLLTMFFYFVLNLEPISSFLLARLISWFVYTLIPIRGLMKAGLFKTEKFSLGNHPKFNKFALNTFIYLGSVVLVTQWDSILITNIDGAYANGVYKSVAFIAAIPIVLVTILHTKLLPFFSELHAKKKDLQIFHSLWENTRNLFIMLFIGYVFSLFVYEFFLNLFLSNEIVEQAGYLFPTILLAICIQILLTPFIATLQAIGSEGIITKVSILQALVFLTVTTLLYPTYGYSIFPISLLVLYTAVFVVLGGYTYTKLNRCNITGE